MNGKIFFRQISSGTTWTAWSSFYTTTYKPSLSELGAAAASHTHTKSQITDFPTSLKNPTSIKIQLNGGTTEGTNKFTYDGSVAKTINITPTSIGAATTLHSHSATQVSGLTANRALISDANGHPAVSAVTSTELGYLDGVTSNIQTQLNGKAPSSHTHSYLPLSGGTLTGSLKLKGEPTEALEAATKSYVDKQLSGAGKGDMTKAVYDTDGDGIVDKAEKLSGLTASRVLVTDSSGNSVVSAVTSTELGYLDGVTSGIQAQLNGKSPTSHTHNYAGSSSAGGAATTALSCTGNAATATKLQTARTINGTSFNGSANITTANWGTARNITIGNTKKSVNGSTDITWSLGEIGAATVDSSSSFSGAARAATQLATARTLTIGKTGRAFDGTANLNWTLADLGILDFVYPVGSIFEWADTGSGANLSTIEAVQAHFGGRWEEYGSGRVLVGRAKGIPEFSDVNKKGGEINHTLTIAEMPRHSHEMRWSNEGAVGSGHGCLIRDSLSGESWPYGYWTGQDGGGQAHNNLQPYITVFRYRRIG